MKRVIVCILIVITLCGLCGCENPEEKSYTFYYLRTGETIRYGQTDAIIAPVQRTVTGADAGLNYLLQLYLDSPTEEGFRSPIPRGTYLLSSLWENDTLVLVLSREFAALEKMEMTLAGACLAATCRDLAGAARIQVRSGEFTYEFDLNNYTFLEVSTGQ